MSAKKENKIADLFQNPYLVVLTASKRARQLLDRAEKHGMAVDTEKVILQSLHELNDLKIDYEIGEAPPPKKRHKEKDKD